ncbi:MAG: hypothetical protein A2Z34_03755 [Planctomycetes bacterium RBG_16_59_8]|nr:MAG: hypothetical protein A2Z34_03755 [Planctomycetes bacterium RBG_16_59_8]
MVSANYTQIPEMRDPATSGGVFPADLKPLRVPVPPEERQRNYEEQVVPLTGGEKDALDRKGVEEAVDRLNKLIEGVNSRLKFGLYGETDQLYVQVIERTTNKVMKMLPPEDLLKLRDKLRDAIGVVLDEVI